MEFYDTEKRLASVQAGRMVMLGLLLASLPGCATTGNPREGGLFGWSESKAIDRQRALRDQLAESSAVGRSERTRQENLYANRADLQTEVAIRDQELKTLRRQLSDLSRALEMGELTPVAAASEADALRTPVSQSSGAGSDQLRADFDAIDQQIQLLNQ